MRDEIGIITMAFGHERYFDQARTLLRGLRLHMPGYKVALLTDKPELATDFDIAVPIDDYRVAGTLLKIEMYRRTPFEQTFFIDSDCIVSRNFEDQLEAISKFDFSPAMGQFLVAGDTDLWLRDVGEALQKVGGKRFAKFNGGVYFFRKSELAEKTFEGAHEILGRADELGVLDFDDAGPGEETLIGLALAQLGVDDLYHDEGNLMRTPLNSQGPITLDVFNGKCSFEKLGREMSPAICHFCGPWIEHPAYQIARRELAQGHRLNPVSRAAIHSKFNWNKALRKFERA